MSKTVIKFGYFWSGLASVLLSIAHSTAQADHALERVAVENFRYECSSNSKYKLRVQFSPVKKIAGESKENRQWSYEFLTADKQYPENKIKLPANAAVRADLVLQLGRSNSGVAENYLWNVIVAPTVNGWKYGGHWPAKKSVTEYQRLKGKRQSLIDMATLSAYEEQPVHTKIPPKDVDKAGTLNDAWVDVFGRKIVELVYAASKGALSGHSGYSLTFYYVPTPALRYINRKGYKWPSFKHVDKEGKVFGFVLTPDGECLAWSSVDVVRE